MKTLNKNNGFTLIETLVSINLSFIAISLIFSFYLFAQKFSESLSRNYVDKYTQFGFFNYLEKTLNNCDEYFIAFYEDKIIINTSNEDSILISPNSISINGIFELTKLDSIYISISTDTNQESLNWNSGFLDDPASLLKMSTGFKSNKILSILFEIKRNNKQHSYTLYSIPSSDFKFQNISNPNLQSSY